MEIHGITAERVDLLPLTASNSDHLATYAWMDISLDPWPYAGTTTTCESLYMGVPVISLAGEDNLPMLDNSSWANSKHCKHDRLLAQNEQLAA